MTGGGGKGARQSQRVVRPDELEEVHTELLEGSGVLEVAGVASLGHSFQTGMRQGTEVRGGRRAK